MCSTHGDVVELVITPRERDLGGFSVRRVLPAAERRLVGPFIFFDEMGPAEFPPGQGIQVRPHPHIGLATITYLFDGEIMHRDDLGYVQAIEAGAVNLMTAGRGIVHSERAGDDRARRSTMHGIQSWLALPDGQEEIEPAFEHYPAAGLPELELDNTRMRLIIGAAYGATSPVHAYSRTLYLQLDMPTGAACTLPDDYAERAIYIVAGALRLGRGSYARGTMLVLRRDAPVAIEAEQAARIMVLGGDAVGPRLIWWNFVARSAERIEQAKQAWREGRFGKIDGDEEFIPLPD